ncbi:protein distal antenna-related [Scaptodrosophila lebanonensis]|uniref:Protein distal antenna-related n=1 Tax=Drosophila lebanonensis TaxID=7225 RepID=A0A6J2U163_DROLE|nr:protein distal antenna-related [Scaptodrosophila lebanonensis]
MDISAYQQMNIRMSSRGKRPLRNLTPNDKVRAIQRIHNGETKASVSRDIGVPESTLRGWCKNEQKLRFMCRQLGSGANHLGIPNLEIPPEKRGKFEVQLLSNSFSSIPNYEKIAFGGAAFSTMEFTAQNEQLIEKLALAEFIEKNELCPNILKNIKQANSVTTCIEPSGSDFSANHMLNQFNLLALLSAKSPGICGNTTKAQLKGTNHSTLSVKNWAKNPDEILSHSAELQSHFDGTNSNGPLENIVTTCTHAEATTSSTISGVNLFSIPEISFAADAIQVTALLDWCKIFNASLNILAIAASSASVQPEYIPTLTKKSDEFDEASRAVLKKCNPVVHSESSNESYYDSGPEDLSIRSSASKSSSPSNSRSQSPNKSNHSDGEQ